MAEAKAARARSEAKTARRPLRRRLIRWLVTALVVVVALPLLLVPLYALVPPPASTLEIWQRLNGVPIRKQWVPLDAIAPALANSVIMSEDGRFCEHRGVDWEAVRLVVESDRNAPRGASTIAMQTAKNLFLWPSRSYVRKLLEVPLAYYIDFMWPKRRLIEVYLNIVEWGPGVFGAEAAAQHWFGIPAARLSQRQAALLAAALPNPHLRNPARPGPGTERVARIIEGRARQAGAYVGCIQAPR